MTEPGWYKDRADERLARWHDGQRWTEHTMVMADWKGPGIPPAPQPDRSVQPFADDSGPTPVPPQQPEAATRFAGRSTTQVVVIAASIVIGISCFLPWIKVVFIGTITASGTDASGGDGWFFLGGAALLGLVAWLRPLRVPALVLSLLGIVGFIYERHHIGTSKQIPITIGFGLWLILAASLVATAATIVELTEGSRPPSAVSFLPPPARRYWWGISMAVVLLVGTLVYGRERHDADFGFGSSSDSSSADLFGSESTTTSPKPTKCTGGASTLTTRVSDLASGDDDISGTVTVEILATEVLPSSFPDNFVDETVTADGKFIGLRVKVTNNSSADVQPSSLFDDWRLTDGKASWELADYHGDHETGVSGAWADNHGDAQPETEISAGFDSTTWAVFDIPTITTPVGVAVAKDSGQSCLGLAS